RCWIRQAWARFSSRWTAVRPTLRADHARVSDVHPPAGGRDRSVSVTPLRTRPVGQCLVEGIAPCVCNFALPVDFLDLPAKVGDLLGDLVSFAVCELALDLVDPLD